MDAVVPRRALAALAEELTRAGAGVEALSGLVSAYVRDCPPERRAAAITEAQAVDGLVQHLEALAGFARALSEGRSVDAAAGAVTLADLARRLAADAPQQPANPPSGDLELFD